MANELDNGAAPVVAAETPEISRLSVPASAIFTDDELKLPVPAPEGAKLETTPPPVVPDPAKPVVPAPVPDPAKPDDTGKPPVVPDPAKPVVPAPVPDPAKPEVKIKIAGKEYTQAELEAKLAERTAAPAPAAAPAPEPVAKPPTPEETAALESKWVENYLSREKPNLAVTDEQVESILSGGKDGAETLTKVLASVHAKAVLAARKEIYADMNPIIGRIEQQLRPIASNAMEVEYAAAEHQFIAAFPDFQDHMEVVRNVGKALLAQYPEQMAKMTREQQLNEVAAQADIALSADFKRWNPTATTGWRSAVKKPAAAPVVPAAPAPAPAAAPVVPRVQPPAANPPAANPAGGATPSFHKQTAKDLQS